MMKAHNVIKALAVILAFGIILSIFSLIISVFMSFSEPDYKDISEEYENASIVKIDIAFSNLTIKKGDTIKVEAQNVSDNFKIKEKDGTLLVQEKKRFIKSKISDVTITLPEDVIEKLEIDAGAGSIQVNNISTNYFDLEQGAGKIEINNSNFLNTEIEGGAGEIKINGSVLGNLKLDAGVGKVSVDGMINNFGDIDCGVGEIDLNLMGSLNDYRFNVEKGIGSIKIDGENISNNQAVGTGATNIKIDGGVGAINVSFKQ